MKRFPILILLLVGAAVLFLGWQLRLRSGWNRNVDLVDVREGVRRLIAERGVQSEGEGLIRVVLDEEAALVFFPALGSERNIYDPQVYFRARPGFSAEFKFPEHPDGGWPMRFNSAGFKSDREVARERPGLRVLVAGDSHSEGVVPTPDNFCSQLELLLTELDPARDVEVLNASLGGYMLYNYLGVLEKHSALRPDVFVMAIFGGNDFSETVPLYGYSEGVNLDDLRHGWAKKVARAQGVSPHAAAALSQGVHQDALFFHSPKWREIALTACLEVTAEIVSQCAQRDIEFVLLYIPPAMDVQRRYCERGVEQALEVFGMEPCDLGLTDRIADSYLETLSAAGVRVVDLRSVYRAENDRLYWESDLHIGLRAHRIAAEQLYAAITGD